MRKDIEQNFNHRLHQTDKDKNATNKSQLREKKSREPTSVSRAFNLKKKTKTQMQTLTRVNKVVIGH
jgi:hypothetical protein